MKEHPPWLDVKVAASNDRFPSWCVGQYRHVTTDEGIFLSLQYRNSVEWPP